MNSPAERYVSFISLEAALHGFRHGCSPAKLQYIFRVPFYETTYMEGYICKLLM